MKTLYLECNAGASGDMILGSLTNLIGNPEIVRKTIEGIGIPGITCTINDAEKSMIHGTRVVIKVDNVDEGDVEDVKHHHKHHHLGDVMDVIRHLDVPAEVIEDATAIYGIIAEAESAIHGKPVNEVHFHEVGALDAIADVVSVCMLIHMIAPEKIISSPLRLGFGEVVCAHGTLPVPAPATARIIRGMPAYAGDFQGAYTTPTGAAIIKHFAEEYSQMPEMNIDACGYGIGKKDMPIANILRSFIGNVTIDDDSTPVLPEVSEIVCEIDDMVPEDLGGFVDELVSSGAQDAYITPVLMKKGRPGFLLTCICRPVKEQVMIRLILASTTTIGVRVHKCQRYEMKSTSTSCKTPYGDVRVKVSEGFGIRKWKAENDDLSECARKYGISVSEVRSSIRFDSKH